MLQHLLGSAVKSCLVFITFMLRESDGLECFTCTWAEHTMSQVDSGLCLNGTGPLPARACAPSQPTCIKLSGIEPTIGKVMLRACSHLPVLETGCRSLGKLPATFNGTDYAIFDTHACICNTGLCNNESGWEASWSSGSSPHPHPPPAPHITIIVPAALLLCLALLTSCSDPFSSPTIGSTTTCPI